LRPGTIIPGTPRRTKALPVCHAPGPATHRTDGTPRRHALACFSDSGTGHRSRSRRLRPAAAGQNRAAMIIRRAGVGKTNHAPHTIPSRKENSAWKTRPRSGSRPVPGNSITLLLGQPCSNDQAAAGAPPRHAKKPLVCLLAALHAAASLGRSQRKVAQRTGSPASRTVCTRRARGAAALSPAATADKLPTYS